MLNSCQPVTTMLYHIVVSPHGKYWTLGPCLILPVLKDRRRGIPLSKFSSIWKRVKFRTLRGFVLPTHGAWTDGGLEDDLKMKRLHGVWSQGGCRLGFLDGLPHSAAEGEAKKIGTLRWFETDHRTCLFWTSQWNLMWHSQSKQKRPLGEALYRPSKWQYWRW